MPVTLLTAIIGSLLAQYAAQDFDAAHGTGVSLASASGDADFITYSEQSGSVFLSMALITEQDAMIYDMGVEDFEAYTDEAIEKLNKPVNTGNVKLSTGLIYPTFSAIV